MRILIARHAEDIGPPNDNKTRGLTVIGKKQAKKLSMVVKSFNPTHIICSTLKRSIETANIVSQFCDINIIENELLDEQFSGNINNNITFMNSKGYINSNESYNGGETYQDLTNRVEKLVIWLKSEFTPLNGEKRPVLITHGRLMTFLITEILGLPQKGFFLAIENTAYVIIIVSKKWRPMLVLPIPGNQYL
ncbi:hypothetical protein CEE45_13270 [Candidatus Heimdallarchaeota archaeon B3_Heim]|nr:MAG: hypothetical protein CEE45_13270 [Candidatus Heimdallarchaeota archaeon B3_Heim]